MLVLFRSQAGYSGRLSPPRTLLYPALNRNRTFEMPMMSSASGLRAAVPCRCLSMSDIPVYRLVDRIFMENIAEIDRCEEQLCEALLTSDVGLLDSLLAIGRAAFRGRVCQYVMISVVAGSYKKQTTM